MVQLLREADGVGGYFSPQWNVIVCKRGQEGGDDVFLKWKQMGRRKEIGACGREALQESTEYLREEVKVRIRTLVSCKSAEMPGRNLPGD